MLACAIFIGIRNYDKSDWFEYNFWYLGLIIVPGVSTITTKMALGASKGGIFLMGFWFNFFGVLSAFYYYSCQYYLNDMGKPWLSFDYIIGIMDCGGIFTTLVVCDTFNMACLLYIAKTGQASKAAVYSTLHASWTIVMGMVNGEYDNYVYPFLFFVYVGYSLISYDKKVAAEKAAKAKITVKFIKTIKKDYEVSLKSEYTNLERKLDGDSFLVANIIDDMRSSTIQNFDKITEIKDSKEFEINEDNIDELNYQEDEEQRPGTLMARDYATRINDELSNIDDESELGLRSSVNTES